MALQFSVTYRNAMLDQLETTLSTSPKLRVYTGAAPASVGASASGTLLVEMALPSDWMGAASGGTKELAGTWTDASADGGSADTPGYFRIWDEAGTTCHLQGTAGIGSGDMSFNGTITAGQSVTVTSFTITAPGA